MDLQQLTAHLAVEGDGFVVQLARGAVCFLGFLAGAVIVRLAIQHPLRALHVDHSVVLLASKVGYYMILTIGLVTALGTMGVNISALVAGLGLGGFALGFALRDAISNVLAGALVLIYRPFRVGDRISVAGFDGKVREVNLRYTVLDAESAHQLIPNQVLFTTPVKVHRNSA